uniref:G-protein coupled receptors family 1 profile domain-containing protein n=1 Tax=Neogobius melanostomus TaxID=47308 RepID=A0A8C6TTF2_9GOBI
MENGTSPVLLQLEGLMVPPSSRSLVFLSLLLSHVFIVGSNLGVVALVWSERALHQPMYLLMCNLAVNDVMNNLVVVPRILWDMLLPVHRRLIPLGACVTQAFAIHMYGWNIHTIFIFMAVDRYIAICRPLRYSLIMSARTLVKITVFSLGLGFLLVGGLLGLSLRLTRCRYFIPSIHCTNASLFNLSCQNTFINNVYGITFTVVLLTGSIGSVVLTYGFITVACLTTRSRSLNRKALQTCSTHLLLYLIVLFSGLSVIALYRYPEYMQYGNLSAILYNIIPPALNPFIYAFQCREIHQSLDTTHMLAPGYHLLSI